MKTIILLSSLGIIALLAEIFRFKKYLFPIVLLGLIGAIITTITEWGYGNEYFHMLKMDSFAVCFTVAIIAIVFLWMMLSHSYLKEKEGVTDHFALILFSLTGAFILVSYSNLTMLFLGIEILSIPLYVLAGSRKNDLSANEASFKYFIMGAFATGFLLFGIALIYGATASFDLAVIAQKGLHHGGDVSGLFYSGILLLLVGLAFKVAIVPFHFWTPDVYQGAPTVITAYMSTVVKMVAFAAFFRLFKTCFLFEKEVWENTLMILSAVTMVVGNITAVYQTNVKRMLAYSSISHAGFMAMAILSMNDFAAGSILYYTIAYSLSSIGAFTALYLISNQKSTENIDAFNGLAKTNPMLAFAISVTMLSLAGIPPLAGFFAKYYIFVAALQSHFMALVVVAVLSSLVGVYYYFKIIIAMYFRESVGDAKIAVEPLHQLLLLIVVIATLLIGILPDSIIGLI